MVGLRLKLRPRRALWGGVTPTMNLDAQTKPKAKTITRIRYVQRKRIGKHCQVAAPKKRQKKCRQALAVQANIIS
jgi:hypothetical protein